ncbi:MAG: STAS domain-containing protein [Anaerolineae bacterium]|nr:STAS domain-containing protein [Anaerolineae bacterium]
MKPWNLERLLSSDLPDPEDARRARLINALLAWFAAGLLIYVLAGLVSWFAHLFEAGPTFVSIGLAGMFLVGLVYAINRNGRLRLAAWLFVLLLSLVVLVLLLLYGHRGGIVMVIPVIILAGAVLIDRRVSLVAAFVLGIIYLTIALIEISGQWNAWLLPYESRFPADLLVSGQVIGVWLMAMLAWLSAGSLFDAVAEARFNLSQTQQRERELQQIRADLEAQVAERTWALEQALVDMRESAAEQQVLLDTIRRQSFPVIPIWNKVVALPVVGVLDAQRADQLLTSLLDGIQQYNAEVVLLDVTGAPLIDREAAAALVQAINGARLIGAECVLVGVSPDVAARLVDLNLDLGGLVSRVDMAAGVRYALERLDERVQVRSDDTKRNV